MRHTSLLAAGLALLFCACGNNAEPTHGVDSGAGGSSTTTAQCEPGQTRECVGPGACDGGQECASDGSEWLSCDCGSSNGSGGNPGTGGTASGGSGGTATGGVPAAGGTESSGGAGGAAGGSPGTGGSASKLGMGEYAGSSETTNQYAQADVYRDGVGYMFLANGWGSGWESHNISWDGTSFTIASLNGTQGANYSPAGYPTVFCGSYAAKQSPGSCGLPANLDALTAVNTGWRWKANGNTGQYNAAWDIWLGEGDSLSAYLMVWLRDPPGQQPAGNAVLANAAVPGVPGTWNIWTGNVNGKPIVSYVKPEGQDLSELEFDVLDFYKDAKSRKYNLPGSQILAVAAGFEIWNGPITNLETEDFYVDVQ